MSTLVVGSSSPLGRAVVAALTAAGHQVDGVSRRGGHGDALDITDADAARDLLRRRRPQMVVYLARPDLPTVDATAAIESAVGSLREFAAACASAGVERLLFASSAAVYGTDDPLPHRETGATPATSPYAQLKLLSEAALQEVADATALTTVSFRIFNLYGPGLDNSLVNRLVAATAGAPAPTVYPTDDFVRDYVHVADAAAAFVGAVEAPLLESTTLNVATGVGTGNRQLLSMIPDAMWSPGGDLARPSISVGDTSELRRILGIVPQPGLHAQLASWPRDDSPVQPRI